MGLSLYAIVKDSARYCRDFKVRRKINLFLTVLSKNNIEKACDDFGVSRMTYYRWWNRFVASGYLAESLKEKSRRPHTSPTACNPKIVRLIKKYRKHYRYGPERIAYYLRVNHQTQVSCSTVARVIQREGLILKKYRTKKINPHKKRYNLEWPGQMIQMDIKFVPYPVEGKQLYAFNAIDDCSRWRFSRIYEDKSLVSCLDFLEDVLRYAPFEIQAVQTDNDTVFTNRLNGLPTIKDPQWHAFTQTLTSRGKEHRLIPPGMKELNGKVERSHRTDDNEFYWKTPRWGIGAIQKSYTQWIWEYNHDRPHSSLGGLTPIEKLTERALTWIFTFILMLGFDPKVVLKPLATQQNRSRLDTYLLYLQYLDSDYFPVSDVLNYYNS